MPNDIALVKLTSPLTFGSTRKPIRISSATTYSIGTTATVSGWGSRSQSSPNIASLNQLYKTTGTINKCNSSYVELKASTTSAYKGDSGGPLTISDSKDLLIGIVCGGKTSNPSSEPSVYTNVGVFYSWILSHVPSLYTISGADLLSVGSTYTYTITPAPTNSDISLSSNLSLVSLSGETLKVKSISNGRAYININSGSYVAANKPLWVGVHIVSGITYNGSTLTAETFKISLK